jgi:hypothetical protein
MEECGFRHGYEGLAVPGRTDPGHPSPPGGGLEQAAVQVAVVAGFTDPIAGQSLGPTTLIPTETPDALSPGSVLTSYE